MSVGADSLMGHLDMNKLLNKETLETGRVLPKQESHNLQIGEVIDAIAQSDPDLFYNNTATLMPVEHCGKLDIPICDAHITNFDSIKL